MGHGGGHHEDAGRDMGVAEPEAYETVAAQCHIRTNLTHRSQDLGDHVVLRDDITDLAALDDHLERHVGQLRPHVARRTQCRQRRSPTRHFVLNSVVGLGGGAVWSASGRARRQAR